MRDGTEKSRDWILHGIAQCEFQSVPPQILDGNGVACDFRVEHDPLDDNYSHSELRSFVGGVRTQDTSKKVKKECRTTLALKSSVRNSPLI